MSDGGSSASLAPFAITVNPQPTANGTATLSWVPPTTNSDGSALTNLAGYRIHYGTSTSAMTQVINVTNVGLSTYTVQGLSTGTWYFSVTAYTTSGTESTLSNVASKTIT